LFRLFHSLGWLLAILVFDAFLVVSLSMVLSLVVSLVMVVVVMVSLVMVVVVVVSLVAMVVSLVVSLVVVVVMVMVEGYPNRMTVCHCRSPPPRQVSLRLLSV
jgi:hypothetical protein